MGINSDRTNLRSYGSLTRRASPAARLLVSEPSGHQRRLRKSYGRITRRPILENPGSRCHLSTPCRLNKTQQSNTGHVLPVPHCPLFASWHQGVSVPSKIADPTMYIPVSKYRSSSEPLRMSASPLELLLLCPLLLMAGIDSPKSCLASSIQKS